MDIKVNFDHYALCASDIPDQQKDMTRCDVSTDRGSFCMWATIQPDCEFELKFDEWAVENDPSLSGLFEDDQAMQEIYQFVESALAIRLKNDELSKLLDDEMPDDTDIINDDRLQILLQHFDDITGQFMRHYFGYDWEQSDEANEYYQLEACNIRCDFDNQVRQMNMDYQDRSLSFDCDFKDDVEGHTFVVSVDVTLTVGSHEETTNFEVNCQFADGKNYDGDTYRVTCHNQSGGDYSNSGLAAWIEGYDLESYEVALCEAIEDCAQSQADLQRQTVEEYLEEKTGKEWTLKDHSVFGCFYPTDVAHRLYECGESRLYVCEDTDKVRPENIVLGFKEFESRVAFIDWLDSLDDSWRSRHADFGMAKLAFDVVCGDVE